MSYESNSLIWAVSVCCPRLWSLCPVVWSWCLGSFIE